MVYHVVRYYFDAAQKSLSTTVLTSVAQVEYNAHEGEVRFSTQPFAETTEVTGPVVLRLWVSASVVDMDVFMWLRNLDADGKDVWGIGATGEPTFLARGWLRVSHHKLDSCNLQLCRAAHVVGILQ